MFLYNWIYRCLVIIKVNLERRGIKEHLADLGDLGHLERQVTLNPILWASFTFIVVLFNYCALTWSTYALTCCTASCFLRTWYIQCRYLMFHKWFASFSIIAVYLLVKSWCKEYCFQVQVSTRIGRVFLFINITHFCKIELTHHVHYSLTLSPT